jgi:integrase
LEHQDIDLKEIVLTVRNTKFRKSRLVPFTESTKKALQSYVDLKKDLHYSTEDETAFFIGASGIKCSKSGFGHTFRKLLDSLGIGQDSEPDEFPRLHDLRHSFATNTLKRFYAEKELDHNVYLPVLSTFLGHTDLKYSQYYLHPDFELLTKAGSQFERQFNKVMKK